MLANERDFSTFLLGDNVYELAEGVIPEIADRLDIPLGNEPNSSDLQAVMEKVGKNKVLRDNVEVTAIDRLTMVGLVERSGVQKALDRSLWSPVDPVSNTNVDALVIVGGVANWQDRTAHKVEGMRHFGKPIYSLAGSRVMDTATETSNLNIELLHKTFGRYPTESEYAASLVVPHLVETGKRVLASSFGTKDGDEIFAQFFEQNSWLLDSRLAVARVANAGVIMALQLRDAARKLNSDFDKNPNRAQTFVVTDSFPLAQTEEEEGQPAHYQKAATALRQVVLTAKKLHEAAIAE